MVHPRLEARCLDAVWAGERRGNHAALTEKAQAAAKVAELSLETNSKAKIAAGNFALAHEFWMLESYYWSLRKQAEVMLGLKCEAEPGVPISTFKLPTGGTVTQYEMPGANAYFAKRRSAKPAAGAVVLFFGMLEFVFDACFAFGNRNGLTYQQFRSKDGKGPQALYQCGRFASQGDLSAVAHRPATIS